MQDNEIAIEDIEASQAKAEQIDESSTLLHGYRQSIEAEYTNKGKLKPLGRWLGVSPAAKKMSKRLMRHAHATTSQEIIETEEVNSSSQARISRLKRHALIKQHNRDARKRERELALASTPEQLEARLRYVALMEDKNKTIREENEAAWIRWQLEPFVEGEISLEPVDNPLKVIPIKVEDFPAAQGGPIKTYFGRVPLGGYLGVELRAIRAEKGC
jgi:hypothetical protein